jgi:serine/threonine protein phosphatase PrpC
MRGKMDCHGLSDVGRKRAVNEDQFLIADLSKSMLIHQTSLAHEDHSRLFSGSQGKLFLVADGMGGEAAGEVASALAVETVARYLLNTMPWFFRLEQGQEDDLRGELRATLEECQRSVEAASTAPGRKRMGTTLTMAYLLWPRLYVVHAGDSRCYLLRGGRLEQVTKDHTVAQRMVEQGALSQQEAEQSRWSHVLYNCVGGGTHEVHPEVYRAALEPGDVLLLCSDGLTKVVDDERLRTELARHESAEQTCRRLVALANDGGGPDNVTVVVGRFLSMEQAGQRAKSEWAEAGADDTAEQEPVKPARLDVPVSAN